MSVEEEGGAENGARHGEVPKDVDALVGGGEADLRKGWEGWVWRSWSGDGSNGLEHRRRRRQGVRQRGPVSVWDFGRGPACSWPGGS